MDSRQLDPKFKQPRAPHVKRIFSIWTTCAGPPIGRIVAVLHSSKHGWMIVIQPVALACNFPEVAKIFKVFFVLDLVALLLG